MAKKKKWMQKAASSIKRRGTEGVFAAKAKRAGMTTRAYAAKVLANKSRYSPTTVKQANFARNAMKAKKKKR